MQHLFEYAVIRVVPRVEREEFINVGVILYCSGLKYLNALHRLDVEKLRALCSHTDPDELERYLQALTAICAGKTEGGPIGQLPLASRFRWLTATRSSVVQTSRVHPGFCTDASETLLRLFGQLVL
ncbi:DUF3037 domain-containing protein [Salmonirosea aquatica]|uniref:DUF3037 domain-containing protein n=1 Tax=Salmonirosea aquatica TaxID=2654236 RepID=UPI00357128A6